MSQATGSVGRAPAPGRAPTGKRGVVASGFVMFAAVLLVLNGLLGIFWGIMAIAEDNVYVATRDYVFRFDLTGWGWVHLILGIVLVLAGLGVMGGALWARIIGVVLAGLSIIASFMFLPYAPVWSIIIIALDVFVIWALCTNPQPAEA